LDVSFSPDGRYAVTASADGKARIYPAVMFRPLEEVQALAKERGFAPLSEEEQKVLGMPQGIK
jgi:hypothetical protein